ncbi:25173_t:CDS:1, partial [Dentiscutata erythropus]
LKDLTEELEKNFEYSMLYQILDMMMKNPDLCDVTEKKYYWYLLQVEKLYEGKVWTQKDKEKAQELLKKYTENNKTRHREKADNELRNIYLNLPCEIKKDQKEIFENVNEWWNRNINQAKESRLEIPDSLKNDIQYELLDRETFLKLALN